MKPTTLTHSTFVIDRAFRATPARVFRAFADPVLKAQWFEAPSGEGQQLASSHDFREGGREVSETRFGPDGPVSRLVTWYHEIVDERRIVFTYEAFLDGIRLSVSLTSIQLVATDGGTMLTLTEQGVYFDGREDPAQREQGVRALLDSLTSVVQARTTSPELKGDHHDNAGVH